MSGMDHLMWGAADLAAGMAEIERLFGVAPAPGGAHQGLGTHNALLSLGDAAYLEIIAPDPAQSHAGLAASLAELTQCALITWAVRSSDLAGLAARAEALGLTVRGPIRTNRQTPDGAMLSWELLFVSGHEFGSQVPFFIDWLDTPHPAQTNPRGGESAELTWSSPRPDELRNLLEELDVEVSIVSAEAAGMQAVIAGSIGPVELTSSEQTRGLSF